MNLIAFFIKRVAPALLLIIVIPGAHAQFSLSTPAGLDNNTSGNRVNGHAWGDLNNDGYPDLIMHIGAGTGTASECDAKMFFNDGPPSFTFTDVTSTKINGFNDQDDFGRQMLIADFNNDGLEDVLRGFGGGRNIEVYYNGGAPNFTFGNGGQQPNVLIGAPIGGGQWNTEGVAAIDWNQDGWLDILVDNDGGSMDIFQNDQSGGFTAISPGNGAGQTGFPASHSGDGDYCTVADLDNDGYVDFYGRKTTVTNFWPFNPATSRFTQQANPNVVSSEGDKGGVMFCDFDSDGDLDMFWTSFGQNQIWRYDGGTTWTPTGLPGAPQSTLTGIDGCDCGDIDNDGDIDIVMGASSGSSYLLRNTTTGGTLSFTAVPIATNANTESMTLVDYDSDGDLDMYTVVNGGANQLWVNSTNNSNYFYVDALKVNPDGSDRFAIGANIVVTNCVGQELQMRQVNGGKGHGSQHVPRVHFGVPDPSLPVYIRVYYVYDNGTRSVVTTNVIPQDLPANRVLTIRDTDASDAPLCGIFANDDIDTTMFNTAVTINVVTNDVSTTGINIASVDTTATGGPANGTLTLNGDSTVTYTPNNGFDGNDTIEYVICDTLSVPNCDTAQIIITVQGLSCSISSVGLTGETCNANQTIGDPADDYVVFGVQPTGLALGTGYTLSVDNGGSFVGVNTGLYTEPEFFRLQDGSANGTLYNVTLTDDTDSSCTFSFSVQQDTCSSCATSTGTISNILNK